MEWADVARVAQTVFQAIFIEFSMRKFIIHHVSALAFVCSVASVSADVFTIGGQTFNTDNVLQTGAIVEGTVNVGDHTSRIFARIEQAPKVVQAKTAADDINPYQTFDRGRSIGRLIGRSARTADDRARYVSFPEKGVRGPQPNKDRVTLELTWAKHGLPNRSGPDLVVFEVGSYEPFAVAVRKVGATEFSPYRYQFSFQSDPTHGVNSVVFELSTFGVAEGEIIDAIRIRNVFNSDAPAGADKVDAKIGEGRVYYPSDVEYIAGHKLLSAVRGDEFRTENLDADLIYAAGLHQIIPLGTAATKPAGAGKSSN